MTKNKYLLFFFLLPFFAFGQYRPSYLPSVNPKVTPKKEGSAVYPGREKLLKTIDALDSSDLLKNASWGMMVADVNSGQVIASRNENRLLIPASLMKAVTTGVGYLQLGPDFRFTTKLEYQGEITADSVLHGDLILTAGGDPSICCFRWPQTTPDSVFGLFVQRLKSLGVNKIEGKITLDKSIFDDMQVAPNWQWGDMGNYFGAGSSALAYNENIIHFWLRSPDSLGMPTVIDSIFPKQSNVEYRNYVMSAAATTGDNVNIYSAPNGQIIELRGTIPMGRSSFLLKGANFNPETTFLNAFDRFLNLQGVITSNKYSFIDHRTPIDTLVKKVSVCNYYSPSYNTLAMFTNKTSHNMFAESILKTLGYRRFGLGSYYSGVRAVDIVLKKQKIGQEEMVNVDGSGLSRNNLVTPSFLCSFFQMMYKSKQFEVYFKSLSEAGESGTIGKMFKGTAAAHNLRAKSGSIERVRSYGGYVTNKKGKMLAFAVIINNFNESSSAIRTQLEKLMIAIAESD